MHDEKEKTRRIMIVFADLETGRTKREVYN